MSKDFTVRAECVDLRSGRRFQPNEIFTPPPTVEQAKRLVAARCLPEGAVDAAEKLEAESATKADKRAKAIGKAQADLDKAKAALTAAEAELEKASEADKAKATETRDLAKKAVDDAEADLSKAQQA